MKLQYLDAPELPITEATLAEEGVFYLPIDTSAWKEQIEKICAERGYKNRDEVQHPLKTTISLPFSIGNLHFMFFYFLFYKHSASKIVPSPPGVHLLDARREACRP
jgi:hypothetical protein